MKKEPSIDITNYRFVALEAPMKGIAITSLIHPSTYFNEVLYSSAESNLTYCIDIASLGNVSNQKMKDAISCPNTMLYRVKGDGSIASVSKELDDLRVPFVDFSEKQQNEKLNAIIDALFRKRKVGFFISVAIAAFVLMVVALVMAPALGASASGDSLYRVLMAAILIFFPAAMAYSLAGLLIRFAGWFLGKLKGQQGKS